MAPFDSTELLPLVNGSSAVSDEDLDFHRECGRHCRALAENAENPNVARLHEELADMHASEASHSESNEL